MSDQSAATLDQVRHIVAVASGKGGVGKSTTAVNLALALQREGQRVGILDADIYGPSLALMLGIAEGARPDVAEGKYFIPLEAHGLKVMSMAFLLTDNSPVVWRGPMASGAMQQMLTQTLWGVLDVLIVDMPPGTGDIQLTLAQKARLAGAVIVTTPQDLALIDARKGLETFQKVDVPVLGIVENMAIHQCSQCGHEEHIFGEGGGERVAAQYGIDLLGALPLKMAIRSHMDSGNPSVVAEPESSETRAYLEIARKVIARLQAGGSGPAPVISVEE